MPFGSHCLREPSALHAHHPQLRGYLTIGAIRPPEASKAQCIDCGKLLSLGSNKPEKQTVHGLKCRLEKCHKNIYTLYIRKMNPVKDHLQKGETGRGIGGALYG